MYTRYHLKIWVAILVLLSLACNSQLDKIFGSPDPPEIERIGTVGDRYEADPGDTLTVVVEANNPEDGPLSYRWSASGGTLMQPVNRDTVRWVAPNAGGFYTISVSVSNTADDPAEAEITIQVFSQEVPAVQISAPRNGDDLVQFSTVTVSASAYHVNGLQSVTLWVNDSLRASRPPLPGSGSYEFDLYLDLPGGPNTLRVEAVANGTGLSGSDAVTVTVEEILPKH
ncbi:MAG: hypothetical protein KDI38_12935 [Calditrichaeota bacterium]|nr:hypothetical protein [Calditrichota bacterium]MCB9087521.1 Ig-like domain-containing protein [Calditrichia bacterium]